MNSVASLVCRLPSRYYFGVTGGRKKKTLKGEMIIGAIWQLSKIMATTQNKMEETENAGTGIVPFLLCVMCAVPIMFRSVVPPTARLEIVIFAL